jgi:epoxyqueuosine reductase
VRLTDDDAAFLVARAKAAGFGDAALAPLSATRDLCLREWIARGLHGDMRYLERFRAAREDPTGRFPNHRSVLVTLAEYGDPPFRRPSPTEGMIARYALGADYHETVRARLRRVQADLRARLPDVWTRPFVDTGPLNEKKAAVAAGMGWIGKNTNVLRRGRGSYFVLGLLLIGADPPEPPTLAKDSCGLCVRCIEACPTRAIVAPYELDARRCVSYLTIEHRGPIPTEFRAAIGNRIFGCDDCQEVCPWNRFASRAPDEPFSPRDGLQGRPLKEWLALDAASFAATFEGSAVLRAGADGFARNVLIAVGNAGAAVLDDRALFDATLRRLDDEAAIVRGAAAWALGRIGGPDARSALLTRAEIETDEEVLRELREAFETARDGAPS